ncbi:MAG: hypothetical protein LBP65_02000 [Puniceicoccales bacterium]|jgi:hypothetical protein|nr:hypothetical protein [Puniceicoccales bacterium]
MVGEDLPRLADFNPCASYEKVSLKIFEPEAVRELDTARDGKERELPSTFLLNQSNERYYMDESCATVRRKCLFLVLSTPTVLLATPVLMAMAAYRLLTARSCKEVLIGLIRLLLSPISSVLLLASASYGVVRPLQGRGLFSAFQHLFFGPIDGPANCFRHFRYDQRAVSAVANALHLAYDCRAKNTNLTDAEGTNSSMEIAKLVDNITAVATEELKRLGLK